MAITHKPTDTALSQEPVARTNSERESAPREREHDLGGLQSRLKLAVRGEIDGHVLYWENDQNGAIDELLYEGFEFVRPSEIRLTSHVVKDADLNDRISRFVGRQEDGTPLRAFLMKCPEEIWEARTSRREAQADEWDEAIYRQFTKPEKGRYNPAGSETVHNTKFRKEY